MRDETIRSHSKRIDIVIPVHNAPVLTRRCIDSVITHLGKSIHRVLSVEVFHAEKNEGFGTAVNTAVSRSDAFYVLILNSDTEVKHNILPLLCSAFDADPKLAAIVPAGNSYDNFDLSRYTLYPGNYIRNYYLRGHAFLIRRDIFLAIGGFDPIFGRGYYEDIDLGRRLDLNGWRFGVHPEAHIYHKKGGSFGDDRFPLSRRNRAVYLSRYPKAQQNLLLLTVNCTLTDLDEELISTMKQVLHDGGYVHWLTPAQSSQLTSLQIYNYDLNLYSAVRILLRGWKRADRRVTEIWIAPEVPFFLRTLVTVWGKWQNLKVLLFKQAAKLDSVTDSS